ncbi:MAG TPA: hypothetical protein VFZ58_01700 [Candidatus Saccharimonadales bacterium]
MKTANIVNVMTKQRQISEAQKTWAGVITVILIAIVIAVSSFMNMPRNLGKELVFINKVNTACEWWEFPIFLGFCRLPSYEYYFATDMNKEQLKNYFKNEKATYVDSPSVGGTLYSDEEDYRSDAIDFKLLKSQEEFYVEFYDKTQTVIKMKDLKNIGKKYIISMSEESYKLAKEAL